jgi:hypothetical protein
MTKKEKIINQFNKWCEKQNYSYCLLYNNDCRGCVLNYFADKIINMGKKNEHSPK